MSLRGKLFINKIISYLVITFFLSGCVAILAGAGVGAACKTSNVKQKRNELETKEEYGRYRMEMQHKNLEPLSYEYWLKEKVKKSEKSNTENK